MITLLIYSANTDCSTVFSFARHINLETELERVRFIKQSNQKNGDCGCGCVGRL